MKGNFIFHHYGLAVKDFYNSINFHKNLGYKLSKEVFDPIQDVNLIFCKKFGFPSVELIKPESENSPIKGYLSRNPEIIYHVCYEIDSKEDIESFFHKNSYKLVSDFAPAVLFENKLVAFYYVRDLGLVEILLRN
tara:strand:- start:648 stop:1052 length:405 start_codon:yes stop_codon:yes gene_type:complete